MVELTETFTAAEKLREIRTELMLRRAVFARLVSNGSMKPADAARRIALLAAVARDYEPLAEAESGQGRLI